MTKRGHRVPRRTRAEMNIVPYIDVMLVLLVIFMVAAPLISEGVDVQLPQAKAKRLALKTQLPLIVTLDAKGRYYLNTTAHPTVPLSASELATRVAAECAWDQQKGHRKRTVLVRGDGRVKYAQVMQAMLILQKLGIDRVGLMTQAPQRRSHVH